jgi:hypothetical protein
MSNQRRFDTKTLIGLARRRGICLSAETDRESLADYLARLVWSWPELQVLLELAERGEGRRCHVTGRLPGLASVGVSLELLHLDCLERHPGG